MSRQHGSPQSQNKKNLDMQLRSVGRCRDVRAAQRANQKPIVSNLAGEKTYNNMIAAAGNNRCMDLAQTAYNNAIESGQVNVVTFNSMITSAGNNRRMDLAQIAYNDAIKSRRVNVVTHSVMRQARQKNTFGIGPHVRCRQHRPYSYNGTAVFFAPKARFSQLNQPAEAVSPKV